MTEPCRIIGVLDNGADGLSAAALAFIREADLAIGAARTLELFAGRIPACAEQRELNGQLARVPEWIEEARRHHKKVVVLATGDPLCHGIAKYLAGKLGAAACQVVPNISTIQLAFARLSLPWQDARICSVHGSDSGEWMPGSGPEHGMYVLLQAVRREKLLAVFTGPHNTPDRIARMLVSEGLDAEFEMMVAERLLLAEERIAGPLDIAAAASSTFADPNVVILRRNAGQRPEITFGLADDRYRQRKPDKGLITKREVRAVSLARMALRSDSVVWDIGAGSGSVGLEAARLCPQGHVYAIEKNVEDAAIAAENRKNLHVTNYSLIHGKAPQGLDAWPDPDAVFIGGSGGGLAGLVRLCLERLQPDGWLVMNFVTFENLSSAVEALKQAAARWDVTQIQASRSQPILDMHRLQAENPVWIVCAQKGTQNE